MVELLDPAEVDHLGRHPVGQHEHVALDRLAAAELVLHLGEEVVVVGDVVGVRNADTAQLLEVIDSGGLRIFLIGLIDVGLPVGDDEFLLAVLKDRC